MRSEASQSYRLSPHKWVPRVSQEPGSNEAVGKSSHGCVSGWDGVHRGHSPIMYNDLGHLFF